QALPQHLEALGALRLGAHAGRGLALAGRRRDRGAFGLAEDLVVIARLVLALGGRLGWHGLILLVVRGGSGGRLGGLLSGLTADRGLALLEDPDRVSERVADAHVDAVEVLGRLLGEVRDAALLELLVEAVRVVGDEDEPAEGSLGDEVADPFSGRLVVERRARLLQRDLGRAVLSGDPDRQPAVLALADVVALLEPELVDVEVERLVLVEDPDRGDIELGDHGGWFSHRVVELDVTHPTRRSARSLLQNCSIPPARRHPPSAASP